MPELPEVETVKNTLKRLVLNKTIKEVKVYYENIIEYPTSNEFIKNIIGETIIDIKRRGKWLMFELNNYYILSHLRMEGKYNIRNINDEVDKHEHVAFIFTDNTELRYKDTRKFGRMHLLPKEKVNDTKPLNELGLEPWDELLTSKYLLDKYKTKKLPIKTVLLDQSIITGIGNIYADEILFKSKLNPLIKANLLTDSDCDNIIKYTKETLEEAITKGGTTIKTYTSAEGVHGLFQQELLVHQQENKPCKNCNSSIIKIKVGGRGTYYCPNCQKHQ